VEHCPLVPAQSPAPHARQVWVSASHMGVSDAAVHPALLAPALASQRSQEPFTHCPPFGLPMHSPSSAQFEHWNRPAMLGTGLHTGVLLLGEQPTLPTTLQP